MPFELSDSPIALSPEPLSRLNPRPVSGVEYYHASVGTSSKVFETVRNVLFSFEGQLGRPWDVNEIQTALDQVTERHPVLRMRWTGQLGWSRWVFDGPKPVVRLIENWDWDFARGDTVQPLLEIPATLRDGPAVEIWLSQKPNGRGFLALKSNHAVIDGMGGLLILQELFRALNGQTLLGSNVEFSDSELMMAIRRQNLGNLPKTGSEGEPETLPIRPAAPPAHGSPADCWKTQAIGSAGPNVTGRLGAALAKFAFQNNPQDGQVVVAMPVDLRRYVPGALTASNLAGMAHIKLQKGQGPEDFKQGLKTALANHAEIRSAHFFEIVKWLPQRLISRLLNRRKLYDPKRKRVETVVISNLGQIDFRQYSFAGFEADETLFAPPGGNTFCILYSYRDTIYATLSVAADLGGERTVDELFGFLRTEMASQAA